MVKLYFMQAECGDAAYLTYTGNDGKDHCIFVDSGFERTYHHVLGDAIDAVPQIDLFVVSHIHDDHIGGAIAYIKAIERQEKYDKIMKWCYNLPRPVNQQNTNSLPVSIATSIDQGDRLSLYLAGQQKTPPQDVVNTTNPMELHGLTIQWLSPSTLQLKKLRNKYANPAMPLERNEDNDISSATGPTGDDYHHKIEEFNLKGWRQDTNIDNGSSIAFYTEIVGFKVLWLADAHPRVVEKALKDLGYTPKNRFKCDYIKVAHHGSKGNNSDGLYDLIDCRNYIISANGENRHYLPHKESLVRILRNKQRNVKEQKYFFHFTYNNATLQKIFEVDGNVGRETWNFEIVYIKDGEKFLKFP